VENRQDTENPQDDNSAVIRTLAGVEGLTVQVARAVQAFCAARPEYAVIHELGFLSDPALEEPDSACVNTWFIDTRCTAAAAHDLYATLNSAFSGALAAGLLRMHVEPGGPIP
jgi:hypothetical protein